MSLGNLALLDWIIVIVAIVLLRLVSMSCGRYMKGVADFLSANRAAGRYLLTITGLMGGIGAISMVAYFEVYYTSGFPFAWWNLMLLPIGAIALLTGWIYYRFRETRALTYAQFFEMRYGRRFRIFSGFIIFASGILNFGIFPAVTGRFFIYFCGLPDHFQIPGIPFDINTLAVVMAVDLILALTFIARGGLVSVMVTQCAQGIFTGFVFLILITTVLVKLSWPEITQALNMAPQDASMLHPFHTSNVKDFNMWYVLISVFAAFFTSGAWQDKSGFSSAPRTPHEAKMGGVLSTWRMIPMNLTCLLLPIAAYVIMHLPQYSAQAAEVQAAVNAIKDENLQKQMLVPLALVQFLPIGVKGLLVTVMLFFSFTSHDSLMHSWGTIFVQDVYMPFKKRALSPEQHVKLLRWAIIGVGVFAFFFSLFYPLTTAIFMFQIITATIWLGGAGPVIIGGLYWRRGNAAGAYASVILGALVGLFGMFGPELLKKHYNWEFPMNNQWLNFCCMITAALVYVVVSLVTGSREKFNLEKMLHRGQYKVESDSEVHAKTSRWLQLVGITREFSKTDKVLAVSMIVWQFGWFGLFIGVAIANLVSDISMTWWMSFWKIYIYASFCIAVPTVIWYSIGGILDIKLLFKSLSSEFRDHSDDGSVRHEPKPEPVPTKPEVAAETEKEMNNVS